VLDVAFSAAHKNELSPYPIMYAMTLGLRTAEPRPIVPNFSRSGQDRNARSSRGLPAPDIVPQLVLELNEYS